jgi:hypothetical protein
MEIVKEVWYDVYDGDNKIISTRDKAIAKRRVFAENCSYRKETDKTWYVMIRGQKEKEAA